MDGIKTAGNNNYIVCFHFKTKRSVVTDHFAEREGFEPPLPFSKAVFKTAAIDRSAISPEKSQLFDSFCFVVYYKIEMRFVFSTTLKIVELTSPVNKLL